MGLIFDSAHLHVAAAKQEMIDSYGWEVFDHPPYIYNLSPSNNHLFAKLKEFLSGVCLDSDEKLKSTDGIIAWREIL